MAIRKLPHWNITDKFPAFYDTESATAIEQTAKLYGAMNDVIEAYNKFVDDTNKAIEDFESGVIKNIDEFKVAMSQQFQDFIDVVELKLGEQDKNFTEFVSRVETKLANQDKEIEDTINNLSTICEETVNEAISNGDIKVTMDYHNKELTINVTGGV